jgi:D-alanyl-D-alanine carboxypeptidase (penicillin-binding protein 5/6)
MAVIRAGRVVAALAILGLAAVAVAWWPGQPGWGQTARRSSLHSMDIDWPSQGQSAIAVLGAGRRVNDAHAEPVPIASVAKVMTAYVVLARFPLTGDQPGFTLSLSGLEAAQASEDAAQGQSVVPVSSGEVLTERQALEALLLPSANNIAMALALRVAGTLPAFVTLMNDQAARLGMHHTTYTDPSGLAPTTVSTAADQLRLAKVALRNSTVRAIAAMPQASIPIAGTIRNTDTLLGRDGVVAGKTGSDAAAGGCFMFEARRAVDGRSRTVIGVVLGQRGGRLIDAGLDAADALLNGVVARLTMLT